MTYQSDYKSNLMILFNITERHVILTQTTNFRLMQTEKFASDNFEFDENGRKLSKSLENTIGKGEIARYECFKIIKLVNADT